MSGSTIGDIFIFYVIGVTLALAYGLLRLAWQPMEQQDTFVTHVTLLTLRQQTLLSLLSWVWLALMVLDNVITTIAYFIGDKDE